MEEINIKVEIPSEFKEEFGMALNKVINDFVRRLQFSMADRILSNSKITDEKASELGSELKERVANRHDSL